MVSIAIVPGESLKSPGKDVNVLVTIKPPEGTKRQPVDMAVVIDVSWSMSMQAKVMSATSGGDEHANTEGNQLSLLDIAKHAVATITTTMGEQDRLSLITFCQDAKTILPLTKMDEAGKTQAAEVLKNRAGFGPDTMLWKGMEAGLDSLRGASSEQTLEVTPRFGHMIVLTDGETKDKADVINNLMAYKERHGLRGSISCFGFGYEIDSNLLVEVSNFAEGSFAFIPDAGFVGTVFVNALSNLLTILGQSGTLCISGANGATVKEALGAGARRKEDGSIEVTVGALTYGQNRDYVFTVTTASVDDSDACINANFQYRDVRGIPLGTSSQCLPTAQEDAMAVERHVCRLKYVAAVNKVYQEKPNTAPPSANRASSFGGPTAPQGVGTLTDEQRVLVEEFLSKATPIIKETAEYVQTSRAAAELETTLLADITGQTEEALRKPEWWQKWGRHYLPSIMFAHSQQMCNNFKDPGIQEYGGTLFNTIRDEADDLFNALAPPAITPAEYRYLGNNRIERNPHYQYGTARTTVVPTVNMADYNDRYAA